MPNPLMVQLLLGGFLIVTLVFSLILMRRYQKQVLEHDRSVLESQHKCQDLERRLTDSKNNRPFDPIAIL